LSAAYAHHNHLAAARRASSGLPLRKSQSAVELGSWRSFNSPEEYWEMALVGEDGQATVGRLLRQISGESKWVWMHARA